MKNDLSNVKVGDKVILSSRFNDDRIATVEKITPKGFIKIGNSLFYQDGRERSSGWYTSHIKLATEKEIEEIERKTFCKKVLRELHDLKEITYDQAVKVMEILKEKSNGKKENTTN